jgi:TonB family protein
LTPAQAGINVARPILSAKNEVIMIVASLVLCLGTLLGAGAPPAAQKAAPLRISSVVMQGKVIHADPPKYPEEARKKNVQGVVTLDVVIGKNGAVESAKVTDGPKELAKAAMNAVKHWRYQTTLLNGKPVEVETTVALGFKLTPPKQKAPEKGAKQN